MRKYTYYLLAIFVFIIVFYTAYSFLPGEVKAFVEIKAVQAAIAVVIGVMIIEYLARAIMQYTKRIGAETLLIRNIVLLSGYIVLGLVVIGVLGVSGGPLLASATFSGLIIGLGMQPILGNFFAGIIILGTGFLKPGKKIKIASSSIPLTAISFPAYKAFSRDTYVPTMKGTVVEVGLMYTKILLETGELIKISNSLLFSSAVVFDEEEVFEPPRVQVRYEFPIEYDPRIVLDRVRKAIADIAHEVEVYIEEQSDKNYYIILVVAYSPPGFKIREFRSKILEKLITVQRELKNLSAQN
ncbi:MAG: mechanosensitive ion channel family protein [Desulfurococcaceae archaeon]